MTTVASIISDAFRETNLIPLGVTPTSVQSAEAFRLLSTIVASVFGSDIGENLNPFPLGRNNIQSPQGYPWWNNSIPGNVFVPSNRRIMCNLTGAGLINLDPTPDDGARMGVVDVSGNFATNPLTINGNGRNIEGVASKTYNTSGMTQEWIYREDLGNWVLLTPIDINGSMPLPPEFDDYFIIMLAVRLNPRYGASMSSASMMTLKNITSQLNARYSQSTTQVGSEIGLVRLTNSYRYYGRGQDMYFDPNAAFNSGYPF